jgi:hypothetical protein
MASGNGAFGGTSQCYRFWLGFVQCRVSFFRGAALVVLARGLSHTHPRSLPSLPSSSCAPRPPLCCCAGVHLQLPALPPGACRLPGVPAQEQAEAQNCHQGPGEQQAARGSLCTCRSQGRWALRGAAPYLRGCAESGALGALLSCLLRCCWSGALSAVQMQRERRQKQICHPLSRALGCSLVQPSALLFWAQALQGAPS